jgi:hypothetical protein
VCRRVAVENGGSSCVGTWVSGGSAKESEPAVREFMFHLRDADLKVLVDGKGTLLEWKSQLVPE